MSATEFVPSRRRERIVPQKDLIDAATARSIIELQRLQAEPGRYIDEGGAGKVYAISESICMKALHERHTNPHADLLKLGNTVRLEASFLDRLTGFTVGNTRTPAYIGLLEGTTPGEPNIIFMERLDAVNFQHIINGTQKAPEAFQAKTFFDELERFILALHSMHKIVHLDLEPRNVMVDRETGMPRVIDFGRSRSIAGLSKADQDKLCDQDTDMIDMMARKWRDLPRK